jgi:hypothetical protein|tara:strand:+ start:198 stop:302 length:105 start_codon:yes stop_codon:yes gene_type:complete
VEKELIMPEKKFAVHVDTEKLLKQEDIIGRKSNK